MRQSSGCHRRIREKTHAAALGTSAIAGVVLPVMPHTLDQMLQGVGAHARFDAAGKALRQVGRPSPHTSRAAEQRLW